MTKNPKRVILKLSGELFKDSESHISFPQYDKVARQIIEIVDQSKVELAVVVGGGNIFRGRQADSEVDHIQADVMGMMATVINGVGLREALIRNGAPEARQIVAFDIPIAGEPFIINKARHHLESSRLIVLSGGLGRPNFSTDSAVAQYADELQCQLILKASTVDGVYDSDPRKNNRAKRFPHITYREALLRNLEVMDPTAFAMCERSRIPIFVFSSNELSRVPDVLRGDYSFGTLIQSDLENVPIR